MGGSSFTLTLVLVPSMRVAWPRTAPGMPSSAARMASQPLVPSSFAFGIVIIVPSPLRSPTSARTTSTSPREPPDPVGCLPPLAPVLSWALALRPASLLPPVPASRAESCLSFGFPSWPSSCCAPPPCAPEPPPPDPWSPDPLRAWQAKGTSKASKSSRIKPSTIQIIGLPRPDLSSPGTRGASSLLGLSLPRFFPSWLFSHSVFALLLRDGAFAKGTSTPARGTAARRRQ
jgi:hypothetical protein